MKLLIATWGEPQTWRKVTYRFRKEEESNCSTLSLIQRVLKSDKTIVLANDTLVGKSKTINTCADKNKDSEITQESLSFSGNRYDEVLKFAKNYIEKTLKSFKANANNIWVLPSAGYYPNATVKGELSDVRYCLFTEFFKIFDQLLKEDKIEVYLDITHGQNFMPVSVYEVLKTVLEILAFFVKEVKLTVLISDPFIYSSKPPFLEIHEVITKQIKPAPYLYYSDKFNFLSPAKRNKINLGPILASVQKIKKTIPINLKESIPAFLGAIYNALPLVIFYTYLHPKYIETLLAKAIEIYKENIKVETNNEKIILEKPLKLNPEMEILAVYGMFVKGLRRKFPYLDEIAYYRTKNYIKVPLDNLKEVAFNFMSFNNRNEIFLKKEIGDLKRTVKEYLKTKENFDWIDYREIKKAILESVDETKKSEKSNGDKNPIKKNEKRNFLAHAGLNENAIKLKAEKGKVYLRYVMPGENREINIYEWGREGLTKI
jgi:CRISPR-associated protein Csx1